MKILFVCTGNICRSPTADGVLLCKLAKLGIKNIEVDSAGTHAYHVGEHPDKRSIAHAKARGYDISQLVARKFEFSDFYEFDLILCMDEGHLAHVQEMLPPNATAQVFLYLEYAGQGHKNVPDPYYGGAKGFEDVLNMIETASDAILKRLGV